MSNESKGRLGSSGYVILFFVALVFFTYTTFPYGILKEAVTSYISKETGYVVRVGELGPDLPIGFYVDDVSVISSLDAPPLELKSMTVELNLLRLFLGQVAIDLEIESEDDGWLDFGGRIGVTQLFSSDFFPSSVDIEAENFELSNLISFVLGKVASDPTNFLGGLLKKIGMKGKLDGEVNFDIDRSNPADSTGKVNLMVKNASLTVDEPSLGLSNQKFKKALVQAQVENGKVSISKQSGFHTQEFIMDMNGSVQLRPQLTSSGLNVVISLKLLEKLKKEYGFFLNMAGGRDGEIVVSLKGSLANIRKTIR